MKEEQIKQIVDETIKDFKNRQKERKPFETQWQLNMNFLMGNQYCCIGYNNEIEEFDKEYFWQEREVFNHIAPLYEIRLAKLQNVRPIMAVVPASSDDGDFKTAKLGKKIINSIYNKKEISKKIAEATKWSEICGTVFYKVAWNADDGAIIAVDPNGNKIRNGEIDISVCSPFEIYPESANCFTIEDCKSIIHAKAYHVDDIKTIWGKDVEGEEINVFSLDTITKGLGGLGYNACATKVISSTKKDYAVVIEKYERPSYKYPNGRLIIVAGKELLYYGDLPYINGTDGKRDLPFVRQECLEQSGSFWGVSFIERVIPVQRAYNAVKNRKHEFINRLSMGILTVEDGSVDVENLEDEGLSPGKILVYRRGSSAPSYMANTAVPTDFQREEDRLLDEFMTISGVSDLIRNTNSYKNMSGTALQLLIEQDDSRISVTTDSIKEAIKKIAQLVLRMYKQFATTPRLLKVMGDNGELEVSYFKASDISSDDVVFESDNELNETLAQRRNMVFELLNAGLLHDESGKLSNRMRNKALDLLGFGIWENARDINDLHIKKASNENQMAANGEEISVSEIDDHSLHIQEHTAYILGGAIKHQKLGQKDIEKALVQHIREHKKYMKLTQEIDAENANK